MEKIMSNFPNFQSYGYEACALLGQNHQGGRATYKAIELKTQTPVVIKQFRFATGVNWDGFKAVEREIEALKKLNHPNIPKYWDSFESPDGLCLVQEYINAPDLSARRNFSPEQVKAIAIKLLSILSYLQEFSPPVIHKDIKPENILVDQQLNVYLIDFGLASISPKSAALSSMIAGTIGFMPPEQLLGRKLTTASDLYGLGITLICLLTGESSSSIGIWISDRLSLDFQHLLPDGVPKKVVRWLEKMVMPESEKRFQSAQIALAALLKMDEANSLIPFGIKDLPIQWKSIAIVTCLWTIVVGSIVRQNWQPHFNKSEVRSQKSEVENKEHEENIDEQSPHPPTPHTNEVGSRKSEIGSKLPNTSDFRLQTSEGERSDAPPTPHSSTYNGFFLKQVGNKILVVFADSPKVQPQIELILEIMDAIIALMIIYSLFGLIRCHFHNEDPKTIGMLMFTGFLIIFSLNGLVFILPI
jgi:serine/threonine protein kinase